MKVYKNNLKENLEGRTIYNKEKSILVEKNAISKNNMINDTNKFRNINNNNSIHFNHDKLNEKTEEKKESFAHDLAGSYGFRLGYKLTDKLTLSVMGDFVQMDWRYRDTYNYDLIDDGIATYMIGGFGLSVLYNIF
jgi:hypothetical protein